MTLPKQKADELISHIRACPTCRLARVFPGSRRCLHGQKLLKATLQERHG